MADRSISIRLSANVQGLVAGFKTAQQAANDFGSQTQKFAQNNRQSLEQVGAAGVVMGGALVGAFGLAVSKFASFDKAMSGVQAATHETADNMNLLRDAAVEAGADTAYSAEEAARGIEEMAKAGVSTADILGGGLNGALSLAAAGSLDVGEAAELAATAMTQFGLAGEDIPHIADLLAAGAGKAQGSVQDMGAALKQAGLVANQTGLTIEETTGGLAAFASAGLVGSDAGTSFKSMLQRLTPTSKEASELMGQLGISAYDAQGNFIGLSEFAGNLSSSMADLTVEERNAAMATIFGSDAVRAAAILYENGAAGVQKWEDAVNDAGFAAETAAIMQNNLAGDLEKLGGAFDTVFLKSGSGANDALRGLVQTLEDVVDKVGQIPAPVLSAGAAIAGITGGALLLGGAFISAVPRIADTVGAINDLKNNAPGATGALGKLGKAAGIAAVALVGLEVASKLAGTGLDDIGSSTEFESAIRQLSGDADAGADSLNRLATVSGSSLTQVDGLGAALEAVDLNGFLKTLDFVGSGFGIFDTEVGLAQEVLRNFDQSLTDLVSGGSLAEAAIGFRQAAVEGEKVGQSIETVAESFPGYIDGLREIANQAGVNVSEQELLNWAMGETPAAMTAAATAAELAGEAITGVAGASAGTTPMTEALAEAFADVGLSASGAIVNVAAFTEYLVTSGLLTLSARDATRAYEEAIDAAAESALTAAGAVDVLTLGANGNAVGFNNTTAAGRAAESSFDAVASAGIRAAQAVAEHTQSEVETQAALSSTYQSLLTAANGFGITGSEADALARSVMGIPPEANIDSWFSEAAAQKVAELNGSLNAINGKRVATYSDHYETTHRNVINTESGGKIGAGQIGITRATGGAVFGPGTGTSDSIPARLSNGEHVLTAREVKLMGGQDAVYDFRSQLTSGMRAFAEGGAVMRSRPVGGTTYMSTTGATENHYHTHVDAAPGTSWLYAREVGREAAMKTKDTLVSLGLN